MNMFGVGAPPVERRINGVLGCSKYAKWAASELFVKHMHLHIVTSVESTIGIP